MRKIEDVILKDGRSLKEVLELHKKWLEGEEGGERGDLSSENLRDIDFSNSDLEGAILINTDLTDVNLSDANLRSTDLSYADLSYADLKYANLSYAKLRVANLRGADLIDANLIGANLKNVNLTDADLRGTNLTKVNLRGADLTDIKYDYTTTSFALQCQEKGSFIGYKKANDKIVELLITEDSKRSSATTRKCRCSKAKVLSITSLDGKKNFEKVVSNYDFDFVYEVGKIVEVKDFDENRWKEYAPGIHFFITRNEAVRY